MQGRIFSMTLQICSRSPFLQAALVSGLAGRQLISIPIYSPVSCSRCHCQKRAALEATLLYVLVNTEKKCLLTCCTTFLNFSNDTPCQDFSCFSFHLPVDKPGLSLLLHVTSQLKKSNTVSAMQPPNQQSNFQHATKTEVSYLIMLRVIAMLLIWISL